MESITEWMVALKIADNGFAAGHIAEGLKLAGLPREEQEARCKLYRRWRPKTDKKNMLPTAQAYDLAIAGIDPADIVERQIEFSHVFECYVCQKMNCTSINYSGDGVYVCKSCQELNPVCEGCNGLPCMPCRKFAP